MKKTNKTAAAENSAREPTDEDLRALQREDALQTETAQDFDGAVPLALASTQVDLAHVGLNEIAYLRRATIDNTQVWSIHSAMGHPLGAAQTLAEAWGAIVQNDMQPVYVN